MIREHLISTVPQARSHLLRTSVNYQWHGRSIVVQILCDSEEVKKALWRDEVFDLAFEALSQLLQAPVEVDFTVDRSEIPKRSDVFYKCDRWLRVRYAALEKNGSRCQACSRTPRDGVKLHVDHIKPRSKFPNLALSLDNLQVLCHDCNMGKSNIFQTDWRPKLVTLGAVLLLTSCASQPKPPTRHFPVEWCEHTKDGPCTNNLARKR